MGSTNLDNTNNITNKSDENINNNPENEGLLKRICTTISIIIAIIGGIIGICIIFFICCKWR